MRRILLAVLALGVSALPALALELPPYVYEQARAGARTVVVLRVTEVQAMPEGQAQGSCTLVGEVESVERGVVALGQEVTVMIPCIGPTWEPMPGPFPGYQQDGLMTAERVRVWMTSGQLVRRGLDFLREEPT